MASTIFLMTLNKKVIFFAFRVQKSVFFLTNSIYLRLKNIELGWSIPQRWADRSFLSGARIFVRGTNVLTFSDFKLWDPELNSSDGAKYPLMRSFSAGVEFKF